MNKNKEMKLVATVLLFFILNCSIVAQDYKYHNVLFGGDSPNGELFISVKNSMLDFQQLDNDGEYSIFIDTSALNYHVYKTVYIGMEIIVLTNDPTTVVMNDLSFNEQLYKSKDERVDEIIIDGELHSIKRHRSACYETDGKQDIYQTIRTYKFECTIGYHDDGTSSQLIHNFFISGSASIKNTSSEDIYHLSDGMRQVGIEALSLHRKYDQSDN
ncbi:hypothetical protein ACKGJO_05270 [Gracilimonas sp. Q87]|uniref:hypothetical protein n=1 Tax=Gracilimonas sp. Q87 TaxID=3384766 RepID=UPI00398402C7